MYGGSSNAGNVWTGNTNNTSPTAQYLNVMEEIHVLLVENDPKALFETRKLLEMCSYKVTLVDLASSAISMLSNQNTKFDVVVSSTDSPDRQGYKLLQLSVAMSIPIVLLSVDEDPFFTSKAIQDGALLNIQKPVPMGILKFLWQEIMRQKMQKGLRNQREINAAPTNNNVNNVELMYHMNESFEMEHFRGGNMNNVLFPMDNNNDKGKQIDDDMLNDEVYYGDDVNHSRVTRKSCTEWTDELHSKFVSAVLTLGEGRCFPKEILQLMNVPGLTRMQVASHLQKCRNETWRVPEDRKNQLLAAIESQSGSNSDSPPLPARARRFGSMPRVCRPSSSRTNSASSHNLPEPDEPTGLVQNVVMGGSTEPMNLVAADNNPHNNVDYGQQQVVVPHHQILPETNNNVNYGAGTDQYSSNRVPDEKPLDEFFNFGDLDSIIDNFASMPQDCTGGFNHVLGSDNNMGAGYDHHDTFYFDENANNLGYGQWNGADANPTSG